MNRYIIGSLWDRDNRNGANKNFEYLFEGRQKIDELNIRANIILNEAKQTNVMNKDVQNQIDDLILSSGESDAEVIQARGGLPLLKDRLNSQDKLIEDNKILSFPHGNLVDKLLNLIDVRGMYIVREDNGISVGIGMGSVRNEVVEYKFTFNDDGLLLLRGVLSGVEDVSKNGFGVTLNGDFIQGSAPSTYTTTVGDTFSFEFEGSSLIFKSTLESRGGVWEFTLDNGMQRRVSCYSPTVRHEIERMVFKDLPHDKYKGVATFIGDDPVNPPTSGTGTSRGYVHYKVDEERHKALRTGIVRPIDTSTAKFIVSPNSIPDFAFAARPAGATYSTVWIPQHSGVTDVSTGVSGKILLDGDLRFETQFGVLPQFSYREISSINISQTFVANNPNGASDGMWQHVITHTLSLRNPALSIHNAINALIDTTLGTSYFGMLPAPQENMSKLVLSNGKTISPIPRDGSELPFGLDVNSAMFVGEYNPGRYHASAMDVTSVRDAVSLGEDRARDNPGLITFRADGVSKVYFNFAGSGLMKAGERYTVTHRIACLAGERYPTTL